MSIISGAALLLAGIAVLQLGHLLLSRLAATSAGGRTIVAETLAIAFTASFGTGILLMLRGVALTPDAWHASEFAIALAAVYFGAKKIAAAVRRLEARRTAAPVPGRSGGAVAG